MDFTNFNHQTPIQIRFVDIDAFGHVNNAVFASYYEMARVHYFDDVLGLRINWKKQGMILAKNTLDYFLPIFLRDKIICYSSVKKLGTKSMEVHNALVRKSGENYEFVASGIGVLVCFDYEKNESFEIPDEWRQLITAKEN